ncbi:MAG: metallophosphoesterase [Spirochaetia bacterium]|jgi:predicted MPP superfamily phosphohydrolase|nr:metallophosphoesterase [Spirochaetia bacterium]
MFSILFGVVILSSFYIGLHGRLYLRALKAPVPALVYWPLFWLISCLYIIIRWGMGTRTESVLSTIGSYWLAAISYFLVLFLFFDLLRLANRFFKFLPGNLSGARYTAITGTLVIASVALVLAYGTWRARSPVVTDYTVRVDKPVQGDPLIVLVADLHLGGLIQKKGLGEMVDMVMAQKPDMVLLAGDILDRWMSVYTDQNMSEEMRRLKAPLGVFAVPGNHEYFGESVPEFQKLLASDGVRMLIDETVETGGFTLVGRNDRRAGVRKSILELIEGLDKTKPLIMMDHQPYNLELAQEAGIDLQLSGHTHAGQFWPITTVTYFMYEINYGLLRKGGTTIIVTSGYGLWGPPLRIGSTPEIVRIRFAK